jgi:hypothetical protein
MSAEHIASVASGVNLIVLIMCPRARIWDTIAHPENDESAAGGNPDALLTMVHRDPRLITRIL